MSDSRRSIERIVDADLPLLCPALPRRKEERPAFVQSALAEADRLVAAITGLTDLAPRQRLLSEWLASGLRDARLLDFPALARSLMASAVPASRAVRYQQLIAPLDGQQRSALAIRVIESSNTATTAALLDWSEQRVERVYRAALRVVQQNTPVPQPGVDRLIATRVGLEQAFEAMFSPVNRLHFTSVIAGARAHLGSADSHAAVVGAPVLDWMGEQLSSSSHAVDAQGQSQTTGFRSPASPPGGSTKLTPACAT